MWPWQEGRRHTRWRQRIAAAISGAFALAACSGSPPADIGSPVSHPPAAADGQASPTLEGMVAGDEPRAVQAGQAALAGGGTAADAAVAVYFTMTATLPSASGLGAGGLCLVHNGNAKTVEVLDFPVAAAGQTALLAAPRGMYALHAKYGRLRWEGLLTTAETVARFGAPVSRALAADLAAGGIGLLRDGEARRVFARGDAVLTEGQALVQSDLSITLGALRSRGVGELYSGPLAQRIADAAGVPVEAVRANAPAWRPSVATAVGADFAHVAGTEGVANGTGIVAMDGDGSAVACVFSMNAPFGAGRMVPGTGLLLATAPGGGEPVAPVLVVNPHVGETRLAATGLGTAEQAVAVLGRLAQQQTLGQAVAATGRGARAAAYCPAGRPDVKRCQVVHMGRDGGLALKAEGR